MRAVVLARNDFIDHEDLVLSRLNTAGDTEMGMERSEPQIGYQPVSLADVERAHIMRTLAATAWNKSKTATILGIERSTLDRKIRRYGLEADRRGAIMAIVRLGNKDLQLAGGGMPEGALAQGVRGGRLLGNDSAHVVLLLIFPGAYLASGRNWHRFRVRLRWCWSCAGVRGLAAVAGTSLGRTLSPS